MSRALRAIEEKECGYLKAAALFNVPKTTLERRFKGENKVACGSKRVMGNGRTSLPLEMENNLKNHILLMEECMFGLTYTDVRRLSYELAERNCFKHKFNKETKMDGYHWLYGFYDGIQSWFLESPKKRQWHDHAASTRPTLTDF